MKEMEQVLLCKKNRLPNSTLSSLWERQKPETKKLKRKRKLKSDTRNETEQKKSEET